MGIQIGGLVSGYKFEGIGAHCPSYEHVLWIVGVEERDVSSVADPDPGSGAFFDPLIWDG
jgi:hypothetical protein